MVGKDNPMYSEVFWKFKKVIVAIIYLTLILLYCYMYSFVGVAHRAYSCHVGLLVDGNCECVFQQATE